MFQDIRFSIRMLAKHPGYTFAALVTLAFGITANTTIFTFANAFLFKPFPYPNDTELIAFGRHNASTPSELGSLSYPDFDDVRRHQESCRSVAAYSWTNFNLAGADRPTWAGGAKVSAGFFSTLGVQPLRGRTFTGEDDQPGAEPVAILSEALWKDLFGARESLVGETVRVDGVPTTVIGIVPIGTELPLEARLWIPLAISREESNRNQTWLSGIGRLKANTSTEQARSELATIGQRINTLNPSAQSSAPESFQSMSLREEQMGSNAPLMFALLLLAVTLLLLIVCTNLANLQLSRAVSRNAEFSVRTAMGASQGRLIRQLLTESFVLSFVAAGLGLLGSRFAIDLMATQLPPEALSWFSFDLDHHILAYTGLIAVVTTLLFGLVPALKGARSAQFSVSNSRHSANVGSQRLQGALVVSEMALALGLIACGTVMMRGFTHLATQSPGFDTQRVLTASLTLPEQAYPNPADKARFGTRLAQDLSTLPGVEQVGFVSDFPLSGSSLYRTYSIEGQDEPTFLANPDSIYKVASPDYFSALGIPVSEGRVFLPTDISGAPLVAVINQPLADRLWPQSSPVGRRLKFDTPSGDSAWHTIVGVVGGTKHEKINRPAPPQIYVPFAQAPSKRISLAMKASGDPNQLVRPLEMRLQAIDPNQALFRVMNLDQWMSEVFWTMRMTTSLFWIFGALALFLSALGIYGVMLFAVHQRRQEIGIRMAMGALRRDILSMILRQGMKLGGLGSAIGLLLAVGMTRALGTAMLGLERWDFASLGLSTVILLSASLLACLFPGIRAARHSPMQILRQQ